MSKETITASAPGKVIISGEHAVVFGKPAIAMATRCSANTILRRMSRPVVQVDVPNLNYTLEFGESQLRELYETLSQRYTAFTQGDCPINEILDHPVDLIPFAFATVWKRTGWQKLAGCSVGLDITIPVGCGMGSSAAVGVSVIRAAMKGLEITLSDGEQFDDSMACERLMHGNPSGVDSSVAVYGGAFRFHNGEMSPRSVPSWPLRFINTGRPSVSTGECVEYVRSNYPESDPIWAEFERVTDGIDELLDSDFNSRVSELLRTNHRLLCDIGVVPENVRGIIEDIESSGGAAKVCGAGASDGDSAGIIMVAGECNIDSVLEKWNLEQVVQC